ncbi:DUF2225 domain-containing protein [Peribacillus kribbensis]|uniref:DUF2225 domain-containing protein n=1 Tax=Peribacillus kribbensis TaxID=356658 RepID=UPI0004213BE5|nr:DUF2225 domain-containing protein [Peribacillus kribbensis]
MEPLFDRNLICNLFSKSFTAKSIRSRFIRMDGMDTDFRPIYADPLLDPSLYTAVVCPHCGYSCSGQFSAHFPPGTKEELKEKVSAFWVPRETGKERTQEQAITAYKLASYCAGLKKEPHCIMAGIFLRISWLYRGLSMEDQELRFITLALHEYERSYYEGDYRGTKMSEIKVLYLIAELSRRTGDVSKSARHFSMVLEKQRTTIETKIIEMAKEQWQLIREKQRIAK